MAGFQRSVVIAKPVEAVFDFSTDLANLAKFLPNVTEAHFVTDGGMRPGAKISETRGMKGKERTAVIEVVEHQRPSVHVAQAAMLGLVAKYTFHYTPEGSNTRMDLIADVRGNFLWRPFLGMMSRFMEREDGEYLDRVKQAMETP